MSIIQNEFNIIDWQAIDLKIDNKKNYVIRGFGRNEQGKSLCVEILDFKPYFYIKFDKAVSSEEWALIMDYVKTKLEIPDYEENKIKYQRLSEDDEEEAREKLLKGYEDIIEEEYHGKSDCKKKLYQYFWNDAEELYYKLEFTTKRAFNLYKKIFNLKKIEIVKNDIKYEWNIELFETNIDPMIRFFHKQNLDPSGWIRINNFTKKTGFKFSRCDYEYRCSYYNVVKIEKPIMAPFIIASFDIECSSDDGSFPIPERDMIIQIGTTIHRHGEKEPYENCMITLGPCNDLDENTTESNGMLIVCKDEKELLLKWRDYIQALDPDVITGYNIWGFDWDYMVRRAKVLKPMRDMEGDSVKVVDEFLKLSRITYETSRFVQKELSSAALGSNTLKYVEITGVVQIDLLKLVQKDYNLDSYKLTNVSSTFLQGKVDIESEHIIKTTSVDGLFIGNQISLVDQYENKVSDGFKFTITSINKEDKHIHLKESLPNYIKEHEIELIEEFKANELELDKLKYNWCENKIDLPPQDIFNNFKIGTGESIREIAVYCVKDCVLCNSLLIKLDVLTKNIGMSNVCCVPLSYLFLRGQGIKIFSVVAKQCQQDNFIMPVITKEDASDTSYEGAIVLDPQINVHFEPVAVMDYNSLYPSSMISENISHDSLVKVQIFDKDGELSKTVKSFGSGVVDPSLMELKDKYWYRDIDYDIYDEDKNKNGFTRCTYVQHHDGTKNVLPRVLERLLKARKDTRKEQKKYDKDDFMWGILEGLQLAYKVTCNSLYGQVGASTSQICMKELAASTTATGRELLLLARTMILDNFTNSKCVYGDSILGNEPLLLKLNNKIIIKTIETLSDEWDNYDGFKVNDSNRKDKEQSKCDYSVWTNNKWSKIKRVIRHKTNKKIYRVNTNCGVIDVTEDHSLLNTNIEIIKPEECKVKETELLQSYPKFNGNEPLHLDEIMNILDKYEEYERSIEEKKAFIYGVFYGDGRCEKHSWTLNNQDDKLLNMCLLYLNEIYGTDTGFEILNTLESSTVNKLVPCGNIKCMVDLFRPLFYDKDEYKIVPDEIINGDYNVRLNFFLGYYSADISKYRNINGNVKNISFDNRGKIGSAQLYYLVKSLNYNANIRIRKDKPDMYKITCCLDNYRDTQGLKSNVIKKIEHIHDIKDNIYVYDLETEEGIFQAGIGEIIVKNTDSVFIKFDTTNLDEAIQLGEEAGELVSKHLISENRAPHNLEYEKTFYPFILFSKKRYVGNKYEHDINKYTQSSMGIVLKRRDNAKVLKNIYQGVISSILNDKDIEKAKKFYKNSIVRLLDGKVKMNKLVISKTLGSNYKNPTRIAHKVLADRMRERDPGNAPANNDRLPYIFINEKCLKCYDCENEMLDKKNMNPSERDKYNIDVKNTKCIKCMKLLCRAHLQEHKEKHKCKIVCRFCRQTLKGMKAVTGKCEKCKGFYCKKCEHTCMNELSCKILQGDKIEHPEYIEKNKEIVPDYMYYFEHQVQTPVDQIFNLVMDKPETIYKKIIDEYNGKELQEKDNNQSITNFFKPKIVKIQL